MKSSEKKFFEMFPDLKQVINDESIDFKMYGQVPLKYGMNEVYLYDPVSDKKTILTQFNVDPSRKYGLKIEFNQQYILMKLRNKIVYLTILFSIISF